MTPAVEAHGAAEPVSKPGLASSWELVQPPPLVLIVQLNVADPCAPVVSVAVTVTELVAAVVGVPVIRPEELIDRPAGRPVAEKVRLGPEPGGLALIWKLPALPTGPDWGPELLT